MAQLRLFNAGTTQHSVAREPLEVVLQRILELEKKLVQKGRLQFGDADACAYHRDVAYLSTFSFEELREYHEERAKESQELNEKIDCLREEKEQLLSVNYRLHSKPKDNGANHAYVPSRARA